MSRHIHHAVLTAALCCAAFSAHAASWGDSLRQQATQLGAGSSGDPKSAPSPLEGMLGSTATGSALSALGVPASGSAGNAAGVITYCMKHNYLNASKAEQLKAQLLGKLGLHTQQQQAPKDPGYVHGLAGTITGSHGQSFSLDKLKGDLREKACDLVLDNAQSLI